MKLSSRLARRVTATAAAIVTAVLIPAVALAAPGRAAQPAAPPGCRQAQLETWIGTPGGVAAGTVYYQLEISNVSARTCTLYGFPGVSAIDANGMPIGSPAQRVGPDPVRLVTLVRGGTAHVELGIGTAADYPTGSCRPVTAAGLRVFAPGDFNSETVPFSFPTCAKVGPKILSVSPALAGTGIPHFSH